MRRDHEPLSLSVAYVHTTLDEQCKIADFDNASVVWPNICDDKRGFAKYS
jgi:hypothetical protein